MATRARDARNKAQTIWSGATVHSRGQNWIKHQHPTIPNKTMLDSFVGAIHYGVSNDQEIDTAWEADTGAWQNKMVKAGYNLHARNILNVGDLIEYREPISDRWVMFQPLGLNWVNDDDSRQQIAIPQAVQAQITDDVMYFPDGYGAGRHFRYQAQTSRLEKQIIIDSAANLPAPTVSGTPYLEIEFIVSKSTGVTEWVDSGSGYQEWDRSTRTMSANRVEYRTPGGSVLWVFDYPKAMDSAGRTIIGQFQLHRQGANRYCTVRIPKSWIDTAVFPIILDPTIDVSIDAAGNDWGWEEVHSNWSNSENRTKIGNSDWEDEGAYNAGFRWTGITIPQSSTIDAAHIGLMSWDAKSTTTVNVTFYAADANNPSAPTSYAEAEGYTRHATSVAWNNVPSFGGWSEVDSPSLVTLIQALVDDYDYSNEAIIVTVEDNGSSDTAFRDLRLYDTGATRLHIEYTEGAVESASESASISPSASESASESVSISPSASLSPSASASPSIPGSPLVFGEQNPTSGEAISWQTWSNGSGVIPDITGDTNWGKLKLDMSGEEGRSRVYDLGDSSSRTFTLTENVYGTGQNDATLQIRGDTSSFLQDDTSPSWETYASPITRSWRYIQIREITNV